MKATELKLLACTLFVLLPFCDVYAAKEQADPAAMEHIFYQEEQNVDSQVKRNIEKQWGEEYEAVVTKAVAYPGRVASNVARTVVTGKVANRFWKFFSGVFNLVTAPFNNRNLEKAGRDFGNSFVNVGGLANDVASDSLSIVKTPIQARGRYTSRIQVCTSALQEGIMRHYTGLELVNPGVHVAALIDKKWETLDPRSSNLITRAIKQGGGVHCQLVPVYANYSDSVAAEMLRCVDQEFYGSYGVLTFNCGGYTREILNLAGMGMPSFPNIGIGNDFRRALSESEVKDAEDAFKSCSRHINDMRATIAKLERGEEVSSIPHTYHADGALQFIISAARGENLNNRAKAKWVNTDVYYDGNKVSFMYESMLKEMFVSLDSEALDWLQNNHKNVYKLYTDLH